MRGYDRYGTLCVTLPSVSSGLLKFVGFLRIASLPNNEESLYHMEKHFDAPDPSSAKSSPKSAGDRFGLTPFLWYMNG